MVIPAAFFLTDFLSPLIQFVRGCLSVERHRALAICANQEPLFEGKELLHFAPEPGLTAFIRSKGVKSYKTCDLFKADVDLRIDVCAIDLPDQSFDAVLCLHVLEHVADDRKAMSELRRILRPSGMAIIMVPMEEGLDQTYEIRRSCPRRTE